jgi:PAS domain S-box-containing protein
MSVELSATEYRLLVQHSPVMIWRAALDTNCDYFNETWLAFTGRAMAQEVGAGWAEGVHPEDLDRCVKYYLDHFARREAFEMEYRLRRHDGVYRWIFDRGVPFYDDAGVFAGFIGSCIDVDERHRAQAAGEEQLADARHFEQWILAIVSHDIRNPLGAIGLAAHYLKRTSDPSAIERTVERVQRGVERIQSIVADLLDLSRERHGGGVPVQPVPTDLAAVCRQAIDELEEAKKERAIELRCEGDTTGQWDGNRLVQALSNLIGNAVQHSPPGSPITVRIQSSDERAVISLHNQGQIAPELLPKIFEAFRSGGQKLGRGEGLGLGLFIAKAIAHAHGGTIDVSSTAMEGTTFRIALPRRRATT